MNGNMEIASSKLAEFIGKGDISQGMVFLTRVKSKPSKQPFERDCRNERMSSTAES